MNRTELKALMAKLLKLSPEQLQDQALLGDLVTESFLLIEFVIELQDACGILLTQESFRGVKTVGDLILVIEKAIASTTA